jgi:hypothetical protein
MCTLNCLYCALTIHNCIGIHSITQKSVLIQIYIFVYLFVIDYCRLSVSLCIIQILEMCSRYFDSVNNKHLASQKKHHTSTRLRFSIGFQRPIATIIANSGYAEPISPIWVKEGKT